MQKTDELRNCTPIKTILMLLIVLYHGMRIFADGGWGPYEAVFTSPAIGIVSDWLNTFHIYAFTLISGYIFYYIKYEKGGYQSYFPFLGNKALRLLVPYVFISAVWVAPLNEWFFPEESIAKNFVLGYAPRQLWFLLMLFWVFAVFWLISDLVNRNALCGALIVCVLYGIGCFAPSIFTLNRGLQYMLYFSVGFLIRKFDLGNKVLYKIPSIAYLIVSVLLFMGLEYIEGGKGQIMKLMRMGLDAVQHVVGAVGAFVILQRFVDRFLQGNKVVDFFSQHSMTIYLVHQQLIYFSIGWFNGVVSPVVLVLINFTFSLVVSVVFSMLMSKTKVTRVLVGSKA